MFARLPSIWLLCAAVMLSAAGLQPVDEASFQRLIASRHGKVVLVNFWATWCEPCREELPKLISLSNRLGFQLINISADEPEQERAAGIFLAQFAGAPPAWIKRARSDEAFINAVDPQWSGALPGLFLYDKTGIRRRSFVGEFESAELENAIRELTGRR